MSTNDDALGVRVLLDQRSYLVYEMRTKQKKSFREIGAAIGLTAKRAHQLYHASLRRIELRKSGGENNPEFALKTRAVHCLYKTFNKREITKSEVIEALKSGQLRPAGTYGYGWKTHREVCQWAGVSLEECPTHKSTKPVIT
jgi:hypothetical protein